MTDRRRQDRYKLEEYLNVFDRDSGRQIGSLANLSASGAMFITNEPIPTLSVLHCRVELRNQILGKHEINIDAKCRWCRKNVTRGWWESGYELSCSGVDKELVFFLSLSFAVGKWDVPRNAEVKTVPVADLRIAARYDVEEPYPVFERNSYREIGKLADLSVQGARLFTHRPIPKGQMLDCKVKLPRRIFQRDYLMFEAECMWSRTDDSTGEHESGYRFRKLSEHDSVIILYLIIHCLKEQATVERIRVVR
jgi:hypothetical protein